MYINIHIYVYYVSLYKVDYKFYKRKGYNYKPPKLNSS